MEKLKAMIIETSALCNLKCKMCPTLSYLDHPSEFGIMKDEVFSKAIDFEGKIDVISLEGWGEPLLDSQIVKRVELAKMKAHKVVFTSNITLLTIDLINGLNNAGLDVLNVSLDGGSKLVYELIRSGASFENVISNLELISKYANFDCHSTFVLSHLNKEDVYNYLKLSDRFGFKQTTLKALDVVTTDESKDMALSRLEMQKICLDAEQYIIKNKLNVELRTWNIFEDNNEKTDCLAGACTAMFIGHNGEVFPCSMLSHDVHKITTLEPVACKRSFGFVGSNKISDIWEIKEYSDFREEMKRHVQIPKRCGKCMLF